jgi:hypothetical protein
VVHALHIKSQYLYKAASRSFSYSENFDYPFHFFVGHK